MTAINILLAEDNPRHQDLLVTALTDGRPHVRITLASSGTKVLDLLHNQTFDSIVMDYHLSDTQADQLLQKAHAALGDCPVLIISSSRDQDIVVRSIRHGGIDFISKDEAFRPEQLWTRVYAAISRCARHRRENRRSERRMRMLSHQAHTDPLTGLQNRRHLEESLARGRWCHDRRKLLACAMLDVDHFKRVNDIHGHGVGDAALRCVAQVIRLDAGPGAVAVRWGGEEFLVLRHVPSLTAAWLWADQLRRHIALARVKNSQGVMGVTATIGLVTTPSITFAAATIDQADDALRLGKSLGRDMVCTGLMSRVQNAVNELSRTQSGIPDPEVGRLTVLESLESQFGPVQWDHLTRHCQAVAELAGRLAENLALDDESVHSIRMAGLFHDIGKCVVPEELLAKPSRLTLHEGELVNRSGRHGAHLAACLGLGEPTVEMVDRSWIQRQRCSNEKCPSDEAENDRDDSRDQGVSVIRVADAVAAMSTARPYANERTVKQILQELKKNRDGAFDPAIVDALDDTLALAC